MATTKTSAKKKTVTRKSTEAANAPKEKKPRRTSGLDAAAQVLAKAKEPMGCKDIVDTMLAKGLWTTNGKTPHATIYAAIIREISQKSKDARFEKVDRGQFQLRKGA